ncbi:hypothetical protein M8J77_021036 [Diaphorina citri]|nr:hypothetical protein M8J77_021036 [Diaphorina citri]
METQSLGIITPGGTQSTPIPDGASRSTESGEPTTSCKKKNLTYLATININSLLQTGKLKQTLDVLEEKNIMITALQETRYCDEDPFESQGFRIYKGVPGKRVAKNIPHLGTGFIVHKKMINSITDFTSINGRLSTLSFKSLNKVYTIINFHAPTNDSNRKDPETTDRLWEKLEEIIEKVPEHHSILLIRDFNAQVGKEKKFRNIVGDYPAHKRTNKNGERLVEICKSCNLVLKSTAFRHLPRKSKTWKHPNPLLGEYQLDHVAISGKSNKEILNVKVLRSANLDSDHYLSLIKLKGIPLNKKKNVGKKKKTVKFNINALKSGDNSYTETLQKKIKNGTWINLRDSVVEAASETIPLKKIIKHPWWTEECNMAIENRRKAWLQWNNKKNAANLENFLNVRKATCKLLKQTKRNFNKSQILQIEENFQKHKTRDFYQTFKHQLAKYIAPTLHIKSLDGKLNLNNRTCTEAFAEYFSNLLNTDKPNELLEFYPSVAPQDSPPPTFQEIKQIIKDLKNNKASGEDGIVAELWKFADNYSILCLQKVIEEIWTTEKLPEDWSTAIIHPIHKKGDKSDPNNYRGISLLSVSYKIFSRALLNRAEPVMDRQLGEYQAGFRKARSCAEQIHNVKSLISYTTVRSNPLVVTFVDFQKAYNCIDRVTIINTLSEFGLDRKTCNLINATLVNTTSKVKFRGELSEAFSIKTGVRQGDLSSPMLFNSVLEKIIREWLRSLPDGYGIRMGYKKENLNLTCLAFADDIALFAKDFEEAEDQLTKLLDIAARTGLKIAFNKTEFITNIKDSPNYIKIGNQKIRQVSKFKYLGEWITPNNSESEAIESRCNKLEGAFHTCKQLYKSRSLSRNLKLCHYNTVTRPSALYAAKTLLLTKKCSIRKLELKDRKILRKILGPIKENDTYRRRHNNELYDNIEDLVTVIRKRRMLFYGHLERMEPKRLTQRIHASISKKSSYAKWATQVKKDFREAEISEELIGNRNKFREAVKSTNKLKSITSTTARPNSKWSEERKADHSSRMKVYWHKRKQKP